LQRFSLESALAASMAEERPMSFEERQRRYSEYIEEAERMVVELQNQAATVEFELASDLQELQFFALPECCMPQEQKSRVDTL
jgi:hypothetical protein